MRKRLDIENPLYDGNASASAFGWQFQVDAAIFLFLYYIDEIEEIVVEGKYQDIELLCKNNRHIYAQAKSVQNGSINNRSKKLEDAIVSLAKTSADSLEGDELLYISNYEAPIKRNEIFKNKVVKLQNVVDERAEFQLQIERISNKLKKFIAKEKSAKKAKYQELLERVEAIDIDDFMVATVYPYVNAEAKYDMFREIENKINEVLTVKFNIQSSYLQRFVRKILIEWHQTFLVDAAMPVDKKQKRMTKEELLWQIVAILSEEDFDIGDLFDVEFDSDLIDEYEMYYNKRSYYHERFSFFNKLMDDYKNYQKNNKGKAKNDFVRENWKDYVNEYAEFSEYQDLAKEYLIKKCLCRLLNHKSNIQKIVERR